MLYAFQVLREMDYIDTIYECVAKDLHEAMQKWATECGKEYDVLAVNGEWCF